MASALVRILLLVLRPVVYGKLKHAKYIVRNVRSILGYCNVMLYSDSYIVHTLRVYVLYEYIVFVVRTSLKNVRTYVNGYGYN